MLLVTGGAGFIGSNFLLDWFTVHDEPVVTLDRLSYGGDRANLAAVENDSRHRFVQGDIADRALVGRLLAEHRPRAIVHLAAETHVDRSIEQATPFVQSNVAGTLALLVEARFYWARAGAAERERFRFLHVSTDEVYGSLEADAPPFTERSPYAPNSPYAASKAAADHLVRAFHRTYALPALTLHCANNFGPRQYQEKLIPLVIRKALAGERLPLYGDGSNIREWLHVGDHCVALRLALEKGVPGETYNVGGSTRISNLDLVRLVCALLDRLKPRASGPYHELIEFVADRPGHDRRYATDASKIRSALGWAPKADFSAALEETVRWYVARQP